MNSGGSIIFTQEIKGRYVKILDVNYDRKHLVLRVDSTIVILNGESKNFDDAESYALTDGDDLLTTYQEDLSVKVGDKKLVVYSAKNNLLNVYARNNGNVVYNLFFLIEKSDKAHEEDNVALHIDYDRDQIIYVDMDGIRLLKLLPDEPNKVVQLFKNQQTDTVNITNEQNNIISATENITYAIQSYSTSEIKDAEIRYDVLGDHCNIAIHNNIANPQDSKDNDYKSNFEIDFSVITRPTIEEETRSIVFHDVITNTPYDELRVEGISKESFDDAVKSIYYLWDSCSKDFAIPDSPTEIEIMSVGSRNGPIH